MPKSVGWIYEVKYSKRQYIAFLYGERRRWCGVGCGTRVLYQWDKERKLVCRGWVRLYYYHYGRGRQNVLTVEAIKTPHCLVRTEDMRGRLKSEDTKGYKSSSGDIFMTKTALVVIIIIIICVLSLGFRRQKKKRARWEKKSHTHKHTHASLYWLKIISSHWDCMHDPN